MASWDDGTRPFEVTLHDVQAGSEDEWDFGAYEDEVWSDEEERPTNINSWEVLDQPRIANLFDTPADEFKDMVDFRDHITSTPRVRLPDSLVSRVRAVPAAWPVSRACCVPAADDDGGGAALLPRGRALLC